MTRSGIVVSVMVAVAGCHPPPAPTSTPAPTTAPPPSLVVPPMIARTGDAPCDAGAPACRTLCDAGDGWACVLATENASADERNALYIAACDHRDPDGCAHIALAGPDELVRTRHFDAYQTVHDACVMFRSAYACREGGSFVQQSSTPGWKAEMDAFGCSQLHEPRSCNQVHRDSPEGQAERDAELKASLDKLADGRRIAASGPVAAAGDRSTSTAPPPPFPTDPTEQISMLQIWAQGLPSRISFPNYPWTGYRRALITTMGRGTAYALDYSTKASWTLWPDLPGKSQYIVAILVPISAVHPSATVEGDGEVHELDLYTSTDGAMYALVIHLDWARSTPSEVTVTFQSGSAQPSILVVYQKPL